jgi:hypothetical protein
MYFTDYVRGEENMTETTAYGLATAAADALVPMEKAGGDPPA